MNDTVKTAEKPAEAKTAETSASATQAATHAQDLIKTTLSRATQQGKDAYSETLNSANETAKVATAAFADVNKAISENYNRSFAAYTEMSQQAIACRSIGDLVALQAKAAQHMKDNIAATTEIYTTFFSALTSAVKPLSDQARDAQEKFTKHATA